MTGRTPGILHPTSSLRLLLDGRTASHLHFSPSRKAVGWIYTLSLPAAFQVGRQRNLSVTRGWAPTSILRSHEDTARASLFACVQSYGPTGNWLETLVLYRMHGRVKSAERWLSAGRARYSQRITHAEGFRNSNRAAIRRAKLMISRKSHPSHGRWTKISSWRVTDGWGIRF